MKFFIPFAENKEQENKFYQSIKNFVRKNMEVTQIENTRIYFIKINYNNINIEIKVGQITDINSEMVIAILHEPSQKIFHICTPSCGVVLGNSIIVPESSLIDIEYFDAD